MKIFMKAQPEFKRMRRLTASLRQCPGNTDRVVAEYFIALLM
jgi:hypothetical protein